MAACLAVLNMTPASRINVAKLGSIFQPAVAAILVECGIEPGRINDEWVDILSLVNVKATFRVCEDF